MLTWSQAARADEFFTKRKLYPNVDFYSGTLVLNATLCLSSSGPGGP